MNGFYIKVQIRQDLQELLGFFIPGFRMKPGVVCPLRGKDIRNLHIPYFFLCTRLAWF